MNKELWTFNGVELSQYGKWDIEEIIEGIGFRNIEAAICKFLFNMVIAGSKRGMTAVK